VIRRAAVLGVVAVASCVLAGTAGAGPGKPGSGDVSFATLTHASCPFVPAGTTIDWTGPETSHEVDHPNADGSVTMLVVSHASGTATDNHGNSYAFDYSNAFRVTSSDGGVTASGTMTDHFSLAGPALHLSNGFIADVTFGPGTAFHADFINVRGDPIGSDGTAHCDPL
jgi:hypothetical protein